MKIEEFEKLPEEEKRKYMFRFTFKKAGVFMVKRPDPHRPLSIKEKENRARFGAVATQARGTSGRVNVKGRRLPPAAAKVAGEKQK